MQSTHVHNDLYNTNLFIICINVCLHAQIDAEMWYRDAIMLFQTQIKGTVAGIQIMLHTKIFALQPILGNHRVAEKLLSD